MCGLVGFLVSASSNIRSLDTTAAELAGTLRHRGPDDHGVWVDENRLIALGHQRLSIVDLSPAGHQPMISHCGRYVLAYNGEIYNHQILRKELAEEHSEISWRGHSDTETLLAAIAAWGVEVSLGKLVGMFAFALWDQREKILVLARDRMGEKPLYYGYSQGTFLFSSELKAMQAHPDWSAEVDRGALALYFRHNCIPAPHTIYRDINKLVPGTSLTITHEQFRGRVLPDAVPYWALKQVVEDIPSTLFPGTEQEATEELERLLRESIRGQMVADVPLGAFLSGGVDSSTIAALMQAQSSRAVRTFTIGFHSEDYNEARHAKQVAQHLGTDHTELYVTPREAIEIIPQIPDDYDEPFADSSQIPTYLVSRMTRQHVTVSLSGDGGDELFCGYNRYAWVMRFWRTFGRLPHCARSILAGAIRTISPSGWDRVASALRFVTPRSMRYGQPGDKMHKLAGVLAERTPEELYYGLVSHWRQPESIVLNSGEPDSILTRTSDWPMVSCFENMMMYLDQLTYLPDDILTKVDRASMSNSLESRVPFLDHRVVEFAWRVPLGMKMENGEGKRILRNVLYRYVPRELIERPKAGFGIPLDEWLRGPLRDWAEALIDERRLREEYYLEPALVRQRWDEHLSGKCNWSYHLWDVLMFQSWLERWAA